MHGDHIFGLPGLLTSRSFQGGEDKPLTVIGPRGLQQFIETTLRLSESHLNYPITYIEIDNHFTYHHKGFSISAHLLNHGILLMVIALNLRQHQEQLMLRHLNQLVYILDQNIKK